MEDGQLCIWDTRSWTILSRQHMTAGYGISSLCFEADGSTLYAATNKELQAWTISGVASAVTGVRPMGGSMQITCKTVKLGSQHKESPPVALAPGASDDVYCLLASGVLGLLRPQGQGFAKWVNTKMARATALSACAAGVAVGGSDATVRLFASHSLQHQASLPKPPGAVLGDESAAIAVAIDRSNGHLATCLADATLAVWDVRDARKISRIRCIQGHRKVAWAAATHSMPALGPQAALTMATCGADGLIKIWAIERASLNDTFGARVSNPVVMTIQTPHDDLRCVRWSPDGAFVAAGDTGGNVHVFDVSSPGPAVHVGSTEAHDGEVLSIDFALVGTARGSVLLMASSGRDGLVHVYDSRTGFQPMQTLDGHGGAVTAVRFAEAGRKVITCGSDEGVAFWALDPETAAPAIVYKLARREKAANAGVLHDCDVEVTSQYAATLGRDRRLRLWDLEGCSFLDAHEASPVEAGEGTRVVIDPSGLMAACCFADGSLRLYDLNSGDVLGVADGHGGVLLGITFLPDSSRIATVGGDGCVMIWNVPAQYAGYGHGQHATSGE